MVRLLLLYNLTVFLLTQTTNVDIFYFLLSFLVFALLHRTCYIDNKYCFLLRIFKQQIWSSVSAIYSCSNLFPLQHLTIAFNHFPFPWFSVYHFVPSGCRELSIAHFSGNTFSELSYRLLYSVPAIFLLPASRCWTVSLTCRVSLYCSSSNKPLFFFHGFVSIICSCNVYINAVILGFVLHLGCPY